MGLAVVSGASRGLGFESARGLGAAGFDLALVAKDADRLQEAAAKLGNEFPNIAIKTFPVDLADSEATRTVIAQIQSVGTVEILMLAHGVMSEKMSKTLKTTDAEWRRVLAINLDAVFTLVNGLAPVMVENRNGRVIIYSACLGRMSGPGNTGGLAPYRISKAGVNALVRNLAHETGLGSRGVLVDAICPNHSRTDMGGPDAPRSAAEGAATAIWLATREFGAGDVTGALWEDKAVIDW
ncbi:MAG: SDR family NAD(P)-dependent oxidoreductase [Actinobacteria bacterium]|jgi:3-oxoacyl-[acyl-carrier protein] reductase|nr:SDR family NAD(P)-dependent oxidoreductase [Actinomycetota bacterium]